MKEKKALLCAACIWEGLHAVPRAAGRSPAREGGACWSAVPGRKARPARSLPSRETRGRVYGSADGRYTPQGRQRLSLLRNDTFYFERRTGLRSETGEFREMTDVYLLENVKKDFGIFKCHGKSKRTLKAASTEFRPSYREAPQLEKRTTPGRPGLTGPRLLLVPRRRAPLLAERGSPRPARSKRKLPALRWPWCQITRPTLNVPRGPKRGTGVAALTSGTVRRAQEPARPHQADARPRRRSGCPVSRRLVWGRVPEMCLTHMVGAREGTEAEFAT